MKTALNVRRSAHRMTHPAPEQMMMRPGAMQKTVAAQGPLTKNKRKGSGLWELIRKLQRRG